VTFERFLALVDNHPRCNILYDPSHMLLQQMDYLTFIDIYHARIKAFHVKDAEFRRTGAAACTAATSRGSTAPGASVRSATGRSTSKAFSAS
jgi:sugar phosphate isomerase/epimerase